MRGRVVEIKEVFLDVLPMVSLILGEPESALFQDWILAIPQRQGKTHVLMPVAYARNPILVPSIGPRPRIVVRKVVPRVPVGAVILAHCPPRAFSDKRPPAVPVTSLFPVHDEPGALTGVDNFHRWLD